MPTATASGDLGPPIATAARLSPQSAPSLDLGSILRGLVFTFVIVIVSALILSLVVHTTSITERSLPLVFKLITTFAIAVGGAVAARRTQAKGWLHGGLVGVVFIVLCFFFSFAFQSESLGAVSLGKELGLGLLAGLIGGVIGVNLQ
jgi:putative membrane protein (TIGR04086 family)